MEKKYLQIIGCGASQGVPTADGNWGNCKKNKKNIRKGYKNLFTFFKKNLFCIIFEIK